MLRSALVREQMMEDVLDYLDILNPIREVVFQRLEVEEAEWSMKYLPYQFGRHMLPNLCWVC